MLRDSKLRAHRLTTTLCCELLGVSRDGFNIEGLIFHSDRGSQYISKEMIEYEASLGIITSVTQSGDPLRKALAERLNGTIKND